MKSIRQVTQSIDHLLANIAANVLPSNKDLSAMRLSTIKAQCNILAYTAPNDLNRRQCFNDICLLCMLEHVHFLAPNAENASCCLIIYIVICELPIMPRSRLFCNVLFVNSTFHSAIHSLSIAWSMLSIHKFVPCVNLRVKVPKKLPITSTCTRKAPCISVITARAFT